jgi:hypothetical protein
MLIRDPGWKKFGSWITISDLSTNEQIGKVCGSVADPGGLSRIRIFSIPDPRSASKILSILTKKMVSKLSEI